MIEFAFLRATEAAAIAAGALVGRGDKNAIDGAAVDAMRGVLADLDFQGTVVIGEGEKDEAPMLYIGERLGTGAGAPFDIAVDPIDGTTPASKGGPGAISVVAGAPKGSLFGTHVPYMEKLVAGAAGRGVLSLERGIAYNVRALAAAMNRSVSEITVAVQDRPRNQYAIEEARAAGARVRIFSDGDVAMALMAMMDEHSRIDMLAGIGGAPEGVIAACAARALGAAMECRLWGAQTGRILALDDLCGAEETFFAASGVTDGELLEGVSYSHGFARTQSILVSSYTGAVRRISSQHVLSPALAAV